MTTHAQEIKSIVLGDHPISIEEFVAVARFDAQIEFSAEYEDRVKKSRALVEKFLDENRLIYGVTTGFGNNVTEVIAPADATVLQRNIILSHAVSVGEPLSREIVRAIQLMLLIGLGQGVSGTSIETLSLIRELLNNGITPYAPGEGSVGYLSVEAHMALVLLGEGRAWAGGELVSGQAALEKFGLHPVELGAKEGLTLTSGTHSVTGISVLLAYDAIRAAVVADAAASISLEALKGTISAFDPRLHALKKHSEQAAVARNVIRILGGSEIIEKYRNYRVQDTYSLRGIPQVHGGAKRAIKNAVAVIEDELHSVSDNPVIIPSGDDGDAIMGANFDSTFVGIQADTVMTALTVLGKISERRTDRMVNSAFSELPAFLSPEPGLNNGYMIPQYTAAALLMEMKSASLPASIDSVPTSANQEDTVSNAYLAVTKAYRGVKKLRYILAIELMCATQAVDLLKGSELGSEGSISLRRAVRKVVPPVTVDRFFGDEIEFLEQGIFDGSLIESVESVVGDLEF
ncbi:HAL/PAL/TAL family ammonia-lyase [Rhodococcus globerulus]|uniref:Aromatic amino acid ammonia-lyase n=1 Tax=Rhodococcus globerulus TaxID=33008 RepID=A0ABU4C3H1_RHOGO|nr:aromatic amino acid ammonia-lyase [Rhodococcus globerulus]MDV6271037.1 aromatic amino acid ammonia-lyase [Rhodococcus globerulus]